MLRRYCLQLCWDALDFLNHVHGEDWVVKTGAKNSGAAKDADAIRDILWQTTKNDWFEYPLGLRLIFFRFPARYCTQAKQGVKVMFTCKGPSSKQQQPPLKPDEKEVLRKKIRKFVEQKYIAPPTGWIRSLIKYFAVPKGLQDWRIVFHAGAN